MKKGPQLLILLTATLALTACSTNSSFNPFYSTSVHTKKKMTTTENETNTTLAASGNVGGSIEKSMDEIDRSKLFHALDNPLGKSTKWTNASTGTSYTVVPTKKLVLNQNPFCREYTLTAVKDDNKRELNGTACVATDGNWQDVNS